MTPIALVLLSACSWFSNKTEDTGCGAGFYLGDDGRCYELNDTDADADADADADSDTDADADTDADTDTQDADGDGFSPAQGDCDDSNAAINPDAEESCGNSFDDDCDGTPGDCGWSGEVILPADGYVLAGHSTGDAIGCSIRVAGDDGGGQSDIAIWSPRYSDWSGEVGAIYWLKGPVTDDISLDGTAPRIMGTDSHIQLGYAMAFVDDTDGDGSRELAIGIMEDDDDIFDLYVLGGPISDGVHPEDVAVAWSHETEEDRAGSALASGGDVTGDGLPDLVIGAFMSNAYLGAAGAVYVVSAPTDAGGNLANADARIYGDQNNLHFGRAVASIGDVNGDGVGDIAANASGYFDGSNYPGMIYVFLGPVGGGYVASDADAQVVGPAGGANVADEGQIDPAGDIDGDGLEDLLISVPFANVYTGAVYIMGGDSLAGETDIVHADGALYGTASNGCFGCAASPTGDMNGDGHGDLLVGGNGAAWLVNGPLDGSYDVDAAAVAFFHGASEPAGDDVGAGDLTGDGVLDLAIGANEEDGDEPGSGAVFVLPGGGF